MLTLQEYRKEGFKCNFGNTYVEKWLVFLVSVINLKENGGLLKRVNKWINFRSKYMLILYK